MKPQRYLILATFFLISIFGANMLLGCSKTDKSLPKTENDLRATILGEWLPMDTLQSGVYLNHYMTMTLKCDKGVVYLMYSPEDLDPDKCIAEEYNVEDGTVTLYFVYADDRKVADYCFQIKIIDKNTMEWLNFGMESDGEKTFRPHNSRRTVRKGSEHNFLSYNNVLPKEIQNRAWVIAEQYRGDYYYAEDEDGIVFLKTFVDSFATCDEYSGTPVTQAVKHCRTEKDTVFVYCEWDSEPSCKLIWLDKKKGELLFCHPWSDMDFTNKRLLIDSTRYTKELLPTKEQLLAQDLERVAFFQKWEAKGYSPEEIERFSWNRDSPPDVTEGCCGSEDDYYDMGADEVLASLLSDYDGDGLVDNITLLEDWLYEKDINHDYLDYTIKISKKLDKDVFQTVKYLKVSRPMLERFAINIPSDGLLELKYDVYAEKGYDTWEYKDKTLADVDKVNSYTYTYKYNAGIEDWDLTKIDVTMKTPGGTTQKSVSPTGRTLYTLKDLDPMED